MSANHRNGLIDTLRGLLIFLMTSSHALGLVDESGTSWLQHYWMPLGWTTTSFIMLSGLTIAWLDQSKKNISRLRHKLWRRSFELILVAFISNVLFIMLKELVLQQSIAVMISPDFWWEMLTLSDHISISVILLPTAIMLFIIALALPLLARISLLSLMSAAVLLRLFVETAAWHLQGQQANHLINILFLNGPLDGFTIVPLVTNGLVGFAFGRILATNPRRADQIALFACFGWLLTILDPGFDQQPLTVIIAGVLTSLGRFAILYLLIKMCLNFKFKAVSQVGYGIFSEFGRYGLMSFLLHRPLLQIFGRMSYSLHSLSMRYFFSSFTCLICIYLVSRVRPKWPYLDKMMRKYMFI